MPLINKNTPNVTRIISRGKYVWAFAHLLSDFIVPMIKSVEIQPLRYKKKYSNTKLVKLPN